VKRLASPLLKTRTAPADIAAIIDFIAGNDHFFLNVSMASCKAMLDAAHGVAHSSVVTAMARNGVEFGIRVSGLGDRWFVTKAPVVDGLYFPAVLTRFFICRGLTGKCSLDKRIERLARVFPITDPDHIAFAMEGLPGKFRIAGRVCFDVIFKRNAHRVFVRDLSMCDKREGRDNKGE